MKIDKKTPFYNEQKEERVKLALKYNWTNIDREKMVGVNPLGFERPLPVPDIAFVASNHYHCPECFNEIVFTEKCCESNEPIVCIPQICGSS